MKPGVGMMTAGFAWLYPLRFAGDGGNHRGIAPTRGCRDSSLPRVLGVSPNFLTTPKNGGSRGLKETITDSLPESTYDGFHVKKRYDMLYSYYDDIG